MIRLKSTRDESFRNTPKLHVSQPLRLVSRSKAEMIKTMVTLADRTMSPHYNICDTKNYHTFRNLRPPDSRLVVPQSPARKGGKKRLCLGLARTRSKVQENSDIASSLNRIFSVFSKHSRQSKNEIMGYSANTKPTRYCLVISDEVAYSRKPKHYFVFFMEEEIGYFLGFACVYKYSTSYFFFCFADPLWSPSLSGTASVSLSDKSDETVSSR